MRIGQKFLVWIIPLLLFAAIVITAFYYLLEKKEIDKEVNALVNSVSNVIEMNLINSIATTGDVSALNHTLDEYVSLEEIRGVMLTDSDGTIKASAERGLIGTKLSMPKLSMLKKGGRIKKNGKVYRRVQPLKNGKKCYGCHDSKKEYLGSIVIDFTGYGLEKTRHIFLVSFVVSASFIIIGIAMRLMLGSLFIKRLDNVIDKVRKVKEGDYDSMIRIEESDEIASLEGAFNEMTEAIRQRDRERDTLFEQIANSKKEWQATFDSITDIIHIRDSDSRIIKANRAFSEHFGLLPRDVINKKCSELSDGKNLFMIGCSSGDVFDKEEAITDEVYEPTTNKTFRILTFPYFFSEGDFMGSVHIARDITDEREREMRLIMSERLASLGQMASGIAHEINNPLASIAGCAEGLLNRIEKGRINRDVLEEYLKIIEEEIARCKKITTGMLSYVRKTTYDKQEVFINNILDRTLEIIGFQGRLKDVEIVKNFMKDIPAINGSEDELRQVFMTIIINALDAMNDSGRLTFSTNVAYEQVIIKIRDTGSGISPEDIGRIFTPFFTTKSDKGGLGLGLSIARKIIADHDGDIGVSSDTKGGTTFRIKLPII